MDTVKAEILHGNVEHSDMTVEPLKGGKQPRTVSKKGAVVKMEKGEFEGLEKLGAVRKAKGELAPAPVEAKNEPPVGATTAPVAERPVEVDSASAKKGR